jgi:DNA-binding transcriptional regulator YiaG
VPRRNPIPKREIEICQRLRSYRQRTHLSQVAFASTAGIDSRLLGSYEHGRSQLNYQSAHKIMTTFAIHPRWLATGVEPMQTREPIPSCELLGVGPRRLLSDVFDNLLAKRPAFDSNTKPQIENDGLRWLYVVDQAALVMRDWLIKLPDDKLNQFIQLLGHEAKALISQFSQLSSDEVAARIKAMHTQEALFSAIKKSDVGNFELPPAPEYFADLKSISPSKPIVDTVAGAGNVAGMSSDIPTWKQIVAALKRLTDSPGAKAQLAADLKTSRQNVNKWLSGAGAPSAELTLEVFRWVEGHGGWKTKKL